MRRLPLIPTIIVGLAVATMIALGIWQWGRAEEKDALRARYEQNRTLPPMALPTIGGVSDDILYRRASAFCLEVAGWRRLGGVAASGRSGTRHIADCRTGAEGPGFAVDMGVSADPKARPQWRGGEVSGIVVAEPRQGGILERMRGEEAARPMLVSVGPAPGLEASRPPTPPETNSSRSYAFQWFFLAAIALVIYLVAVRRRQRAAIDRPPPRD